MSPFFHALNFQQGGYVAEGFKLSLVGMRTGSISLQRKCDLIGPWRDTALTRNEGHQAVNAGCDKHKYRQNTSKQNLLSVVSARRDSYFQEE